MGSFSLEMRYALRERAVLAALCFVVVISSYSVITGAQEIDRQEREIAALSVEADEDRHYVLGQQTDAGGAAYYAYHVTYDTPSSLAFAALGTREDLPWKHRIKMLALEGQIYESDTGNPELSRLGRLDFAFVVSVLLPLILILLLYDLEGRERRDGRYELLRATSVSGHRTLDIKAAARASLVFVSTIVPFVLMAALEGASFSQSLLLTLAVFGHLLFWLVVCRLVTVRCTEAPTAATALLAIWLLTTSAVPALGRIAVESLVPIPSGGELLLAQREAVNDAWDLPKSTTMEPFVASYPEWREFSGVSRPFEWKWYYAFQQMGDESVAAETKALQAGISQRDSLMSWVSILSPPLATERWLTRLAQTDRTSHQKYVQCVRAFHAALRAFHYPMLFGQKDYSAEAMADLPQYETCET